MIDKIGSALSALFTSQKKPFEDKKNFRVSKRGYHSKCHLWHGHDDVNRIKEMVWDEKRKPIVPLSLFNQCGNPHCIRLTHLVPTSKSDIKFIELLRENRDEWHSHLDDIKMIAKRMRWSTNELSLVLRINEKELEKEL